MKTHSLLAALALSLATGAFASPITYTAALSGPNESPVNASPGTGFATVIFDSVAHTLDVSVNFSGLESTTTASHIHCCTASPFSGTAGVATQTPTFIDFPLGVTSGSYSRTFDTSLASTYNPAFVTANGGSVAATEAAFGDGLAANETYLNIHSIVYPAGEIRGFLVASAPVPEPGTMFLGGLALGALLLFRKRKSNLPAR
jgi:hypothetical protein